MSFWSSTLPADALAGEHPRLAQARTDLHDAAGNVLLNPRWVCETMHSLRGDWQVASCGTSLPNTHWHLITRPDGIWAAWRVHHIRRNRDGWRVGDWQHLTDEQKHTHLSESVAVSPMALTLADLMEEITRHGSGFPGFPNDYPYAEVHALSLVLGMEHEDADMVRFLEAVGGFAAAHALARGRAGLHPGRKSDRIPVGEPTLF